MGLRPTRVITSILEDQERARLLSIEPFRATPVMVNHTDKHLFRLGLVRFIRSSDRIALTPAGRVARRLLQELDHARSSLADL